ncbi:hypothetical protein ACPZ19_43685 [Amycolatopsis lurida]
MKCLAATLTVAMMSASALPASAATATTASAIAPNRGAATAMTSDCQQVVDGKLCIVVTVANKPGSIIVSYAKTRGAPATVGVEYKTKGIVYKSFDVWRMSAGEFRSYTFGRVVAPGCYTGGASITGVGTVSGPTRCVY